MDISAAHMRDVSARSRGLDEKIKTLLSSIQAAIIESSKDGGTAAIVPVPINFNVVNMSNTTAQTIIYHTLITTLEAKGFTVKITMSQSSVTYHIEWGSSRDEGGLREMRRAIAARAKPRTAPPPRQIEKKQRI